MNELSRRGFLKGLLATSVAMAAPEILLPENGFAPITQALPIDTRWLVLVDRAETAGVITKNLLERNPGSYSVYRHLPGQLTLVSEGITFTYYFKIAPKFADMWLPSIMGCEFTGAYFVGDISPIHRQIALSRCGRYPSRAAMPAGVTWPSIDRQLADAIGALV